MKGKASLSINFGEQEQQNKRKRSKGKEVSGSHWAHLGERADQITEQF